MAARPGTAITPVIGMQVYLRSGPTPYSWTLAGQDNTHWPQVGPPNTLTVTAASATTVTFETEHRDAQKHLTVPLEDFITSYFVVASTP